VDEVDEMDYADTSPGVDVHGFYSFLVAAKGRIGLRSVEKTRLGVELLVQKAVCFTPLAPAICCKRAKRTNDMDVE